MKNKKVFLILGIVIILIIFLMLTRTKQDTIRDSQTTIHETAIAYYTCGMHPSVRVSPEEYNKGKVNCPICNMKLTPILKRKEEIHTEGANYFGCGMEGAEHVFFIKEGKLKNCPICGMPLKKLSKQQADKLKGVISKVKIQGKQIQLAGVQTQAVKKLHLYKEIRTVGKVAYDPQLAIAQEEFISSLKALDKIKEGAVKEIRDRTVNLVESAKRKLILLGLSIEQIGELAKAREVQTSLILPEKKMWIYGDVYEYELGWVRQGEKVKVTTSSLPGEEFYGVISSINPVVDAKTRSVTFRVEVDNSDLKLKPEMYVDVIIKSMYTSPVGEHMVLAIPKDAVLDTGTRRIIWVDIGNGEYEGREISIGPEVTSTINRKKVRAYPVLKGLKEGEMVVTKANFLIDSQSQISGVAASAYGGALGGQEKKTQPVHQH
jgi:multidrug efflux pump subunit AcrA (membrane-fusion protein)